MSRRILVALLALSLTGTALGQKKKIEKADDLPRFSYQIDGKLEDLVRDEAKFRPFAEQVRRDIDSVLAGYEIPDKATERQLLGTLAQIDYLDGRYADALVKTDRIRTLQEKPADKLLSGLQMRSIIEARQKAGNATSDAYRQDVATRIRAALDGMPYPVIENDVKTSKMRAELIGEALILGNVRDVLQPTVDRSGGTLSSDLAPGIVGARYALVAALPLKQPLIETYSSYLAAHQVEKKDIWATRDVSLEAGRDYPPVVIAVWDSGVDTTLFPGRVATAGGKPAVIAFDRFAKPAQGELFPIPDDLRNRIPQMKSRLKGFSDLQANLDTPEASEVKQWLSTLKPEAYKAAIEEISLAGNYIHGTHVAGIALAGNPYARVLPARIEFDWHLIPDPCPSQELSDRSVKATKEYVDFMKKNGVKVVNMSWGGSVKGYEQALELCGIGKTPDERKAIARKYFDAEKGALEKAITGAPDILFVAAAGNSNSDASFVEDIPAAINAANLLAVGAVDKAGDEAPFTSYGPTVRVHANGYQVESYLPGGERIAESGTSMASPQVANLAGKMLAVNPRLKPTDIIGIVVETADKTADGRRTLVNPAKALAAARARADVGTSSAPARTS